ncbi:sensor histidine kinase [Sedimenticola hydrogenitrophicus]|uniref:sensor histidine kinase n=1 Tax=Sedimenticola hydrogenitrophicus TaxID=2967975 RepID=UPI0021A5D8DA|nr:HAMP domain-containing sensor histidine kinase [Sedimenticola hydrogenitrophicus]
MGKPNLFLKVIGRIQGTLRYKLLTLVLFPIVLIMPIALALAIYWGASTTYAQLYLKVNTDLSVSHDIFRRIREDYLARLGRLTESYSFRTALEAQQLDAVQTQLAALKRSAGFTYLRLLDRQGNLYGRPADGAVPAKSSPSLVAALRGEPRVAVEIFDQAELERISPALARQNRLPLIDTDKARPTRRNTEDRAMMIRALHPVEDTQGRLVAVVEGAVSLNGNFAFVDTIRDLVYGPGSLPEGSIGTVTVFIDDVRITTNVPLRPGERALGTRVSNEVRSQVLDRGEAWIDSAFVVNDWYLSAYEPIEDVHGQRVGMLYAGFLEEPFRTALWRALGMLVLLFLLLMGISSLLAVVGAKSIFKPLEKMSQVVRATRAGGARRVGALASRDEIGELAREFDAMLDLLAERSRQIQAWADQLEHKVEERTAELQSKNQDLQRTIRALRETRQQLVVAEKLAALGELTAGVAHEINNPAAVMLGNLDLITAELGPAIKPVEQEIRLVMEQIYRIKDIVNNLLQYARPDEYAGYLTQVDVNGVVEHTLALVRHLRKQREFVINLSLQATGSVEINEQELQQVIVNLVVNAVHALPAGGGEIEISTRDWKGQGVVIRVRDNGMGMDDEAIGRVFNPFFSTKRTGEGSGLGLSVSYGLIRRYGGNITVTSKPGEGACFSVWLLSEPVMATDEETIEEQLHALL